MKIIDELPGASERPGDSRIILALDDVGALEIRIPARGATFITAASCILLALNLLIVFVLGFLFLVLQKSVLGLNEVTAYHMTPTLHRGLPIAIFFLLLFEWVGIRLLIAMLRTAFTTETIRVSKKDVTVIKKFNRWTERQIHPAEEVNAFQLKPDPIGFNPSILSLIVRGKPYPVGEYAQEAEREWLNSIGNAQLKSMR